MLDRGPSNVRIKGIVWIGTRTERFAEMRDFIARITGRPPWIDQHDFAVFDLPNGDRIEIFRPGGGAPPFDAPVAGFLVEDVDEARAELEAAGIAFIGPVARTEDGNAWSHFRAPDGNVYEITSRPDHPAHVES
jgi:hypothetical protein